MDALAPALRMDASRHHLSFLRAAALLVLSVAFWAASAGTAGAISLPAGFEEETLATGLDQPSMVSWAPDGRMFVAERSGRVRVVTAAGQLLATPVIDISDHVNDYWDHGLLGMAVDASFASNHYLYLLYTYDANPLNYTGPKTSRLTRVTVADNNTASAETVLLGTSPLQPCPIAANIVDCIPSDGASHSIGSVRSDPTDGTLWVGSGDASDFGGVDTMAFRTYDQTSFAGKIDHIDRNGRGLASHPFCPSDTDLTHVCTKVHSMGFRNPFRFTLRPGAGPAVGDVGWNSFEEIDLLSSAGGKNHGWPCYEANSRTPGYDADTRCSGAGGEYSKEGTANADVFPVHNYPHPSGGAAIVGGPTYTGGGYPAQYQGSIFFADYVLGTVSRLVSDGQGGWSATAFASGWSGVDLEAAPGSGDLVYADLFGGEIRRIKFPGTTEEVDYAAGRPTSASSSEDSSLGPENAVDGNSSTRWSSGFSDGQWWQVDLGTAKTIDAVELNWENAYASQYRIATSTDGTNFTTVADETIAQSGLHTTSFAPRSARYVRVTGISRATQFGISFWDARVLGPATGPPPGDLAQGHPATASSSEDSTLGPEKAVDGSSTTRWSSGFSDGQWWQVDLGSAQTIDSVELNWENAYASQYRIATSTDGTNFTTVADETISQPGLHTTSFAPRSARYVRVTGIARATQFGISFWDAKVFGTTTTPTNQSPNAVASATPTSGAAPLAVAFRGDTSSDPDGDTLTYDWDFGDGTAHSTTANPSHTYTAAGSYTARLTVSDGRGGSDSDTVAVSATSGNTPPSATITAPADGSTYRDGVSVSLAGSGQDAEDGTLSGAALDWHVLVHHSTHLHDLGHFSGTSASFVPLTDHDADTWYEIILTATDSGGLTATKSVRIDPQTVALTIASTPAGAPVTYAGTNRVAPYSTRSAVGFKTTVGAADLFTSGANTYLFGSWSDAGARTHNITIPTTDLTLTAAYAEDKAALRTASASSTEGPGLEPAKAVDNSSTTRWSSQFLANQWWQVDLGRTRQVNSVSINWEVAYASKYDIRVSTNGSTWTTAATVNITAPGWKTTTFTTRSARYIRVLATTKKTQFGISFWDARVQGPAD
jgi:PKD repeat protein/glucose/arabinose dehydrogenase